MALSAISRLVPRAVPPAVACQGSPNAKPSGPSNAYCPCAVLKKAQSAAATLVEPLAAAGLIWLAVASIEGRPTPWRMTKRGPAAVCLLLFCRLWKTTASSLSLPAAGPFCRHPAEAGLACSKSLTACLAPAQAEAVTAYDASRAPRLDAV